MKDLDAAKQIISSIQARLEQHAIAYGECIQAMLSLGADTRAIREQLEEALGDVCMADLRADADGLMADARGAISHE